jgi:hypothetical protein
MAPSAAVLMDESSVVTQKRSEGLERRIEISDVSKD